MKIGIVDMGGGYRGIYGAGVLDYCMDRHIQFDLGIGVSAGSCNLISYACGQDRRNLTFYSEFGLRKEAAGAGTYLHKKSLIDLDYLYSTLSNSDGEYPLDYPAFVKSPMEFYAVAVEAKTGTTRYFGREAFHQDDYSAIKASCSLPLFCHPYPVDGVPYYDGAIGDPIPFDKAFELGCDKVVVLMTKPVEERRSPDRDEKAARFLKRKYPAASKMLRNRARVYNAQVERALELQDQGKVFIVAPEPDTCGVSTFTRDQQLLRKLYQKGYEDGQKLEGFMNSLREN